MVGDQANARKTLDATPGLRRELFALQFFGDTLPSGRGFQMRTVGRIALVLLLGLFGTGAIIVCAGIYIESNSRPRLSSGSGVQTSFWDRGYVSASGTWVMEGSKQAFPHQVSEFKCYRDEKECVSAQAEITFGDTLYLSTDRHQVKTWDLNVIVFTNESSGCVNYVYTITRITNRIVGTRGPKPSGADEQCSRVGVDQRSINMTMRDGYEVWKELHRCVII